MEQVNPSARRRSDRSKVLLSASLQLKEHSLPVTLRNLSEHGALVQLCGFVGEGEEVMFRRDGLCAAGRVAWVSGNHVGIAFAKPLRREAILRHVPSCAARPVPARLFRRPAVRQHPLSLEERRLMDMLVAEGAQHIWE